MEENANNRRKKRTNEKPIRHSDRKTDSAKAFASQLVKKDFLVAQTAKWHYLCIRITK